MYMKMLGTFPKIFPSVNFPNVQFPKRQLPKYVLEAALGPQSVLAAALGLLVLRLLRGPNLALGKLPLGKLHIWEVATREMSLGKSPLGKCLWKST